MPMLEKYQIIYVEPQKLSAEEKIRLFNMSDVIVGAWGAAACNCVFMPEKSIVIELCNPDRFDDYMVVCRFQHGQVVTMPKSWVKSCQNITALTRTRLRLIYYPTRCFRPKH